MTMESAMTPIRLLVVDDHNLFRRGLIALLAAKGIKRATELPETAWPAFIAEAEAL